MINATQVRVGNILRIDGAIFRVMTIQHITPGKGNAQVQADLRNLKTGNKNNIRWRPSETIERIEASEREMTFLYQDGTTCHFMDMATCEQHELAAELLADMQPYLKPDSKIIMLSSDNEALSIRLPQKISLTVTECDPPTKGSAGALKDAVVDTGAHFKVPLFIKPGDVVVLNTETGAYVEKG